MHHGEVSLQGRGDLNFTMYADVDTRGEYARELTRLGETYRVAMSADVQGLASAITAASQSSLIGVGSGGSFTVASLLCNLHEAYTGRVSRPSTPLEIICNPTLASSSPAFFISAEGKNPDIVEALIRARDNSARVIHVITNRKDSPLTEAVAKLRDVRSHVFGLTEKDGYLATNSLLLDATLVGRAFGELDPSASSFPSSIEDLRLGEDEIGTWIRNANTFANEAITRGALIVVYAPSLRPIAADLESKLSESAMLHVQVADLRSFAHGRHLWLSERPSDCVLLAMIDPSLDRLWQHMQSVIPADIPRLQLRVGSKRTPDMVAALVAELHFVALLAKWRGKDPGRPIVPVFGRSLYYADLPTLVAFANEAKDHGEREKFAVLGARWPYQVSPGAMRRARKSYQDELETQVFRAAVFDYDGTLRTTQQEDIRPAQPIVDHLCRLTRNGIIVAIVSGRGGSLRERLREGIPESEWARIHLGLYNGGWLSTLEDRGQPEEGVSEFLNHVGRIVRQLQTIGVPILAVKPTPPYQVSIRFRDGVDTEAMWFVVGDSLRQAGLDLSGMVRSRHSIDVLAPNVSKSRLIAHLIQMYRVLPHEVITFGDQGAWPGNDAALLEHRFSLSVDFPSRRLDRGWKLAPYERRGVDAMLWYLDRTHLVPPNGFRLSLDSIASVITGADS